MIWKVILSRQAIKDGKKIAQAGYKEKIENLLNILKTNPFILNILNIVSITCIGEHPVNLELLGGS